MANIAVIWQHNRSVIIISMALETANNEINAKLKYGGIMASEPSNVRSMAINGINGGGIM